MPNHVKNVLKFKNLKPDDVSFILSTITNVETPIDDSRPIPEYEIDFDKIIPEPRTIEECPEDCIVESAREAHITEDKERPWFNWYNWHTKYWNTKWNAYDCYTKVGKSYITFVFSTAWSSPRPIITKLALLGYDMEYRYADEDIGSNCGRMEYSCEQSWRESTEEDLDDPERFATYLWNHY